MEKDQLTRKLAVILHADVVGSTALVQQDEALAHKNISEAFERLSDTIREYGGKAREVRGDALVAEFERASDAVAASLLFQNNNEASFQSFGDQKSPRLRIGISLGEIIIGESTMTGAGVVLAQRLEQLAEPGGVVVQGSIAETVPTRMPFSFTNLGEQKLKGFDQTFRAFAVGIEDAEDIPAPDHILELKEVEQPQRSEGRIESQSWIEELTGISLELPDKPSIAVLPFQNMSEDPEQEYFADGMAEEIITALSRVPDMVVIARNSTFAYKGKSVDVRVIGRDLGVRNILEGSVRKSRDRLRITAQLVDTQTGDHIWAERYDRKTDDLFEIQDEIARKIVEELQVNLGVGEAFRFVAGRAKTIEAWELVVRAAPLTDTLVCNDTKKARELITRALEIDPEYSGAWAIMGWVHWLESVFNWSTDSKKSLGLALEAAEKAVELDPQNPEGYSLLGSTYLVLGDIDRAIEMCKRAIEIAPANSYGVAILANALIDSGEIKQGIVKIKKAIRLCPFPPGWYFSLLGTGLHLDGKHEEALKPLEIAISREPDSHLPRLWLVSALVELNRIDDAKKVAQQILEIEPDFSALDWAATYKAKSHGRLKDNMLAAGFIQ